MSKETSTIRHEHKYCPCSICADTDTIAKGLVYCIIDNCFFQKELRISNTKRKYELQGLSNLNKKQRKHYEELTNGKYPHCYFCNDLEPPYQTVRVKGSELELCQECGYLLIKELEIF